MKIEIICPECIDKVKDGKSKHAHLTIHAMKNSAEVLKVECINGHKTLYQIENTQYDINFHIACNAIADGYYKEAISSFTASLESLYWYGIKTILISKNRNQSDIEEYHKFIKLSERLFGAFSFLWVLDENRMFKTTAFLNKMAETRNDVVHNGKILSQENVLKYGEKTISIMKIIIDKLQEKHTSSFKKANEIDLDKNNIPYKFESILFRISRGSSLLKEVQNIERCRSHYSSMKVGSSKQLSCSYTLITQE